MGASRLQDRRLVPWGQRPEAKTLALDAVGVGGRVRGGQTLVHHPGRRHQRDVASDPLASDYPKGIYVSSSGTSLFTAYGSLCSKKMTGSNCVRAVL